MSRACELGAPALRPMPGPPEKYQLLGLMVIVREGGSGYYYHPAGIDEKRLTMEGAAAHYWQAAWHHLRYDDIDPGAHQALTRRETWRRFGTLPHALEVNA